MLLPSSPRILAPRLSVPACLGATRPGRGCVGARGRHRGPGADFRRPPGRYPMAGLIEPDPSTDDEVPPRRARPGGRIGRAAAVAVLVLTLGYAARHLPQGSGTPVAAPPTAAPSVTVSESRPQAFRDLLFVTVEGFTLDHYFGVEQNPEGPF